MMQRNKNNFVQNRNYNFFHLLPNFPTTNMVKKHKSLS